MADYLDRRVGGLTIRIDRTLCVGFGDCIEEAPETFVLDDEGLVRFRDAAALPERERLIRACDVCPVDALSILDAEDRSIVP
jgi:ferredoxin